MAEPIPTLILCSCAISNTGLRCHVHMLLLYEDFFFLLLSVLASEFVDSVGETGLGFTFFFAESV